MKVYFDPKKSVFSPSEIAVIEEVVTTLCDCMPHLSRFGTCIIDHQLENPSGYNEAHLAACFDLPSGIFHYQSGPDHWVTSHRLAEESIDELLKWPSEQCLYRPTTRCQLIESGIYHYEGEHNVMVINCDRGRFLISCHVNYESKGFTVSYWDRQFDENKAFRLALLELLANLRRQDEILQKSRELIMLQTEERELIISRHVYSMFGKGDSPAIHSWRSSLG